MSEPTFTHAIYFKVFGLAEDEHGQPAWAGVKIELNSKKLLNDISYEELTKNISLDGLLGLVGLSDHKAEIITPEEYELDYGDEDEEEYINVKL